MLSCGTDIVNIDRFNKVIFKHGSIDRNNMFLKRIFTSKELDFLSTKNFKLETIAGRFSAKEAVIKAINCICKISTFKDIEILESVPKVYFKNKINFKSISVSISHEKTYALSFCIVEV